MKKLLSIFLALAILSSVTVYSAEKDFSDYLVADGIGHDVNFNYDYSSLISVSPTSNGEAAIVDVAEELAAYSSASQFGKVLRLSLSGSYSSAPYVASGDSGNGMLSYQQSLNKVVQVSMDMALSDPSLTWTFFQTKGWTNSTTNSWKNGYAQMQVSGGKLIAAGTEISNITIEPNTFHNYMMIVDVPEQTVHFYFDGVCVHENSIADSGILGYARWAASFPKSYSTSTTAYFDNIKLRVLSQGYTAELCVGSDANNVPYEGTVPTIKFSKEMNSAAFSDILVKDTQNNTVSYTPSYDNASRVLSMQNMKLLPNTSYTIDLSKLTCDDGGSIIGSPVLAFKTKPLASKDYSDYSHIIGVGHSIDFDDDNYLNALALQGDFEVVAIGDEVAELKNNPHYGNVLKLSLSGSYDSAPYVASGDGGNGILSYKQSVNKIALISMDMALSDTSGTWTFFQSKAWTDATTNSWKNAYAQMQVSGGKLIAAGDTVPGVSISGGEFHNYKMIVDIGDEIVYFYFDNVCVHQKSIEGSGMLGYARWAASFPKSYSTPTTAYFDNIKLQIIDKGYSATLDVGGDINSAPYETNAVSITFSENMIENTLDSISVTDSDGNELSYDGSYNSSTKKYVLRGIKLSPYTTYRIDMSSVACERGTALIDDDLYLAFTTQRTPIYIADASADATKVCVDVNNRTDAPISALLIAGYYDGASLIACKTKTVSVPKGDDGYELALSKPAADCELKVYLVYADNLLLVEKYTFE